MELVTEKAEEENISYIIDITGQYYNATVNGDGNIYGIDIFPNEKDEFFTVGDLEHILINLKEHIKAWHEFQNPEDFKVGDRIKIKETKYIGYITSLKHDIVIVKIDIPYEHTSGHISRESIEKL